MKRLYWTPTILVAATLAITGCGKKEEPAPTEIKQTIPTAAKEIMEQPAPTAPKTAPKQDLSTTQKTAQDAVRQTAQAVEGEFANVLGGFQSADADTRSAINKAVTAMKDGRYGEATTLLQQQLTEGNLTPEQQQLAKNLMAEAQKHMVKHTMEKTVEQAVTEPEKALTGIKQTLPFGK